MKKASVLILFVGILLGGCDLIREPVLESKDVLGLKVEDHGADGSSPRLKISGLAFNSSMAVDKITTVEKNGAITVLVHLFRARRGTSGSFTYDLAVPTSVNEVRFGEQETEIWHRGIGVSPQWK
jgi:hypothetical protein